jgi:hypothetical protein
VLFEFHVPERQADQQRLCEADCHHRSSSRFPANTPGKQMRVYSRAKANQHRNEKRRAEAEEAEGLTTSFAKRPGITAL